MSIFDTDCMDSFIRVCTDGWAMGWHERNGGNLSYLMSEDDVIQCHGDFKLIGQADQEWHDIGVTAPELAEQFLVVTAAGSMMRTAHVDPARLCGVVQIDTTGSKYRMVWGFHGGGRPTSELPTHILGHAAALRRTGGTNRVIYHAHCPSIIAVSTLVEPDPKAWAKVLWRCMTEYVLFFPNGVGVVPWMVAGSTQIAEASALCLEESEAVVWTQHGIFVSGDTCDTAFGLAEMAEKAADIYLKARTANGGKEPPFTVSNAQLHELCDAFGVVPKEELF